MVGAQAVTAASGGAWRGGDRAARPAVKTGRLRFLEVKGRANGTATVTITSNEIRTGLNKPDDFILALGIIGGDAADLRNVCEPFQREPDFGVTSVNYNLQELLVRASEPS